MATRSLICACRNSGDAQRRGDIFKDRQIRIVDELLVDHGHIAFLHRHPGDVAAIDVDRAGGRLIESGHEAHQRGLAGEGRSEENIQGTGGKSSG